MLKSRLGRRLFFYRYCRDLLFLENYSLNSQIYQVKYFISLNFLILTVGFATAQQSGVISADSSNTKGYILFAPLLSKTTYLIDKAGTEVKTWKSEWLPAQSAYLLPNGHLLRTGIDTLFNTNFPKSGGWIEEFDWNNQLIWSFLISDQKQRRHHDICALPNGNILALVWEVKTKKEAIKAGRNPKLLGELLWSEKIVELRPKGKNSANVVWEWHVWDHLVQDFDKSKKNFGKVEDNPQLLNINFMATVDRDWLHFNSISYDATYDQVVISNRNLSEIFVLDHSTTTKQAASHKGGKSGHGGDLLYRWGNTRAYDRGKVEDQKLFSQHCAAWLGDSSSKIIVFNNGLGRPSEEYSSVEILPTHRKKNGTFGLQENKTYFPEKSSWSYTAEKRSDFYSANVSSAQVLPNGHVFICEGAKGYFFEIDANKKIVWSYLNPYSGEASPGSGVMSNRVFKTMMYAPDYAGLKILKEK
ncbi:hypothetical protein CNR22_00835 [Sphingobacteriaceae bacterium]|nr:hypothetical protein CNR22_00835 [Sphingobacteriaceae bacterium]